MRSDCMPVPFAPAKDWLIARPVSVVPSLGVVTDEGPKYWIILTADDHVAMEFKSETLALEVANALNFEEQNR